MRCDFLKDSSVHTCLIKKLVRFKISLHTDPTPTPGIHRGLAQPSHTFSGRRVASGVYPWVHALMGGCAAAAKRQTWSKKSPRMKSVGFVINWIVVRIVIGLFTSSRGKRARGYALRRRPSTVELRAAMPMRPKVAVIGSGVVAVLVAPSV